MSCHERKINRRYATGVVGGSSMPALKGRPTIPGRSAAPLSSRSEVLRVAGGFIPRRGGGWGACVRMRIPELRIPANRS
jgi:hypothetical protein